MDIEEVKGKPNKSAYDLNPFKKEIFDDKDTSLPRNGDSKGDPQVIENLDLYKRSGTYIEYGDDIEPDLDKAKLLRFDDRPVLEETDEEDNVYPLSIKYNKKKAWKVMLMRYLYLFILLFFLIPPDLYTFGAQRSLEFRTGYFADRIWKKSVNISGVTEFKVQTKNCIVYLLENTESTSKIDLYVSASTSTSVSTPLIGGVQEFKVSSEKGFVQ